MRRRPATRAWRLPLACVVGLGLLASVAPARADDTRRPRGAGAPAAGARPGDAPAAGERPGDATARARPPSEPAARARPPSAPTARAPLPGEATARGGAAIPAQDPARAGPPAADAPRADGAARRRRRRPEPPCLAPPVELVRVEGARREVASVSLTLCDGTPRPEALDALSVLARPHGTEAPSEADLRAYARRVARRPRRGEAPADPALVAPGILRLDAGLLPRLARIAARFPGKAIEIVSGWRPGERVTSRHHHGRAIDLRVRGVSRERLRDFARSLDETGVGYYPNSVFVHVDVRERRAYWVDRSGPGEDADYGQWPPPEREQRETRERVLRSALASLDGLEVRLDGAL
jgi:hypothetical protein